MRRRILLAILLAVTVTAAALGSPLGVTGWLLVDNFAREDLASSAQRIAAILDDQLADNRPLDLGQVRAAVPQSGQLTVRQPAARDLTYGVDPGPEVVVESVPIARGGTVELAIPSGPLRTRQMQVALAVILLVVLSVGTGTVVATVTARRLAKPLRHVADRAARLGGGDFRPDGRRYEVAELDMVADALDASATALAQLVQRERQLVGDVSHQLRSRLTALQLRLESLTSHPDSDVAEEAQAAQEQADRLAEALDELLAAARAASEVGAEPVELTTVLPEVSEEWRQLLKAESRTLRLRVADGLMARATPARLREVIGVLLDNALRHGSGNVTLTARRGEADGTVVIEVTDSGDGVPDELAPYIFERGFSGAGSFGVGLALARALAEADGGRLELSGKRPATFSLFLRVPSPTDVAGVSWPAERVPR
ncbi:histidine kinase [Prauserella sp. PE36]|uniref:Signal transduction histidine-protein kinase/phosphatase MprB n=1 Tax=Prauserella endophytica TaxID=1592324 RepID=A0ABY2RX63_9PSEU|nr:MULTISPECIES: ATP-binding protein [Prauserella]PXY19810.1 histidine kinase [Prauserella coralliicola]RBM18465.1 histidine kinase [Prauserella sp. PE36]TKG64265.1 HAMP domain-containing histidine kinase [Prauserella endophytica]